MSSGSLPLSEDTRLVASLRRQFLTCAICQESYKEPKILPCLHTFCRHCLEKHAPTHSLSIACPTCKHQSILPLYGAGALLDNAVVKELLSEIAVRFESSYCSQCLTIKTAGSNSSNSEGLCNGCANVSNYCSESPIGRETKTQSSSCDAAMMDHDEELSAYPCSSDKIDNQLIQESSKIKPYPTTLLPFTCISHSRRSLNYYCADCDTAVCDECSLGEHQTHRVGPLDGPTSLAQYESLNRIMEEASGCIPAVKDCRDSVRCVANRLKASYANAQTQIEDEYNSLIKILEERKRASLENLTEAYQTKRDILENQLDSLNWIESAVESTKDFAEQRLKISADDKKVEEQVGVLSLLLRKELSGWLVSLCHSATAVHPEENEVLHVEKDLSDIEFQIRSLLQSVGKITTNSAVAFQTSATGDSLKRCWVGTPVTVLVTTRDRFGKPVKTGGASVTGRVITGSSSHAITISTTDSFANDSEDAKPDAIGCTIEVANGNEESFNSMNEANKRSIECGPPKCVSDILATVINGNTSMSTSSVGGDDTAVSWAEVKDLEDGTYEVKYSINADPGYYLLEILLFGNHIRGSPFRIRVCRDTDSPERQRGSVSRIPHTSPMSTRHRGTKRPSSTRSLSSGVARVLACQAPNEDDLVIKLGAKGRGKGEFVNPQAVTSPSSDRILVTDSNNQTIQLFSITSGKCLAKFGTKGRQPGQLQRPTGIAVTANGNYLIADYESKWVSVFSPEGRYINKIGAGRLLGPKGVCVDQDGHIIVIDNKAGCIYVFQPTGKLIHRFPNPGQTRGTLDDEERHLADPHFCAVNKRGEIIVTDFHNHCVKVFDIDRGYKFSFGSSGEGNGQFNAPTGVGVDEMGNIVVADWGNSRIQIFDPHGSFLSYVNTTTEPLYGPQGLTVTPDGFIAVADSGNHCVKVYRHQQHPA